MNWYRVIKPIPGLKYYQVGDRIPLYHDRFGGLSWHVWKTIISVPNDCVEVIE